jgi:hypothetical protein
MFSASSLPARALAPGLDVPGDHKAQRKSSAAEAACSFYGVSKEPAPKIALLNATFGTVLSIKSALDGSRSLKCSLVGCNKPFDRLTCNLF